MIIFRRCVWPNEHIYKTFSLDVWVKMFCLTTVVWEVCIYKRMHILGNRVDIYGFGNPRNSNSFFIFY